LALKPICLPPSVDVESVQCFLHGSAYSWHILNLKARYFLPLSVSVLFGLFLLMLRTWSV
jgi:hypothetical protein